MKRSFSFMLLCLLAFMVSAQISHTAKGDVDKTAQSLLQKAAKVFESKSVSFTVTMVNYDTQKKETARATAQVLYNKGRYRVTAPKQVLYSDGKAVWHWNKEVNEVVVNPLTNDDDNLVNPAHLLKSYDKNFRPKYIRTEEDGTAIVDLQPKKGKSYHKLRLALNEKNGRLLRMEIHNYDGSRGEYHLSAFKTGVPCNEADFVFDAANNKGVEVIDMR